MNRRRSDFEKGLRVSLASLFEHEPRTAVLCVCFDRYQPGLHTKFSIQGTGEDKARRAFAKHGPSFLEILSGLAALAHEKNHGSLPTLTLTWQLVDTPSIESITYSVLEVIEKEVRKHRTSIHDLTEMEILLATIRG